MDLRQNLVTLAQEFGTADYVKGGGGNISAKNDKLLWVKPSGIKITELTTNNLAVIDRESLRNVFFANISEKVWERESQVKELVAAAVVENTHLRPSVEAPFHEVFPQSFVVHTHPAFVNGLTCSFEGKATASLLFPEVLWVPYTDPGYTLSKKVRQDVKEYIEHKQKAPSIVFLQNHGVIVAGNTVAEIQNLYCTLNKKLLEIYCSKDIAREINIAPVPTKEEISSQAIVFAQELGDEGKCVSASGGFAVADKPITPDHIVYAKAYCFKGKPEPNSLIKFKEKYGYAPRVADLGAMVLGLGSTDNEAKLALELAKDGALVKQLTAAFGGINYLNQKNSDFIENWEVEAYRRKMVR